MVYQAEDKICDLKVKEMKQKNQIFIKKFSSFELQRPPEDGSMFAGSKSVFDVKILVINYSPVDSHRHIFVKCVCVCVISH